MEKKNLLKKIELTEELGMKFDEAAELFSEETLGTMKLVNATGGNDSESGFFCFNTKDNCDTTCYENCICPNKGGQEKNKTGGNCAIQITLEPPEIDLPTDVTPVTLTPPKWPRD